MSRVWQATACTLCGIAAGVALARVTAWGVRRWQGQVIQWPS